MARDFALPLRSRARAEVYDVMKRKEVKEGDVVIRQGEEGDWFYVVDDGEYVVTLNQEGQTIEIMTYTTEGGTNPCFGELALMYSKPRAATVTAITDGMLWAMDRKSFRAILMKSSSSSLTKTLRSVKILASLSVAQIHRLQELLSEETYFKDEYIIEQCARLAPRPTPPRCLVLAPPLPSPRPSPLPSPTPTSARSRHKACARPKRCPPGLERARRVGAPHLPVALDSHDGRQRGVVAELVHHLRRPRHHHPQRQSRRQEGEASQGDGTGRGTILWRARAADQ